MSDIVEIKGTVGPIRELVDPGLDLEIIKTLGASMASIEETAAYLKVHPAVIEEYYFETWQAGNHMGRFNLKTWQMEQAQKANVDILKWLGVQHLGQHPHK